jgi:hypothetical protein
LQTQRCAQAENHDFDWRLVLCSGNSRVRPKLGRLVTETTQTCKRGQNQSFKLNEISAENKQPTFFH